VRDQAPAIEQKKRSFPLWAAALPGLIIALFFMGNAVLQFSRAAGAIKPVQADSGRTPKGASCVEIYAITLGDSDGYVREWSLGMPATKPSQTPERSTVLRGVARNGCGEELKNVRLRFVVHDEEGRKGDGNYLIENLQVGEAKNFERVWMGRVTSYDITADH
jgi:hypothetical protein